MNRFRHTEERWPTIAEPVGERTRLECKCDVGECVCDLPVHCFISAGRIQYQALSRLESYKEAREELII